MPALDTTSDDSVRCSQLFALLGRSADEAERGADHADVEQVADPAGTPETALRDAEAAHIVRAAFSGMIPEHQVVLTLRNVEGLTFAQIGACLGISAPAAFNLHKRALERMRISLAIMGVQSSADLT